MTPEFAEKALQQLLSTPEAARPNKNATPQAAPPSRNPVTYCKGVVFPKVRRRALHPYKAGDNVLLVVVAEKDVWCFSKYVQAERADVSLKITGPFLCRKQKACLETMPCLSYTRLPSRSLAIPLDSLPGLNALMNPFGTIFSFL